mgnify:FL=1
MPNWAGSNWYFLAYTMLGSQKSKVKSQKYIWDKKKMEYWMPVDWYNGGMEHTTLHLLYSRFIYKVLWDIGAVPHECGPEPYKKRTAHGMILGEGNEKMSKSRGNVVTPEEVVEEFGADTLRVYEMFIGPFEQAAAWDSKGILGVKRFLDKVWVLASKSKVQSPKSKVLKKLLNQTIKKVSDDIENMRFNTAVSAMMILVNEMSRTFCEPRFARGKNRSQKVRDEGVDKEIFEQFLKILAPFAPHICEEIWEKLGHRESIFKEVWPKYDAKLAAEDEVELVVQINGKMRDKVRVSANITEAEAKAAALELENVKRHVGEKKIKKVIFVKGRLINLVV